MRFSSREFTLVPYPNTQLERVSGVRRRPVFMRQVGVREELILKRESLSVNGSSGSQMKVWRVNENCKLVSNRSNQRIAKRLGDLELDRP
uniref:Uncharacterized protein n=1 Tax=Solanum tuberosum TaxID=4113 RepID=M1DD96_SOLTU